MGAAVKTWAAGEKAVAVCNLANILVCAASGDDGAGAAVLPKVNVLLGVERDDSFTRGTRCGLNSHAVFKVGCKQSVRICVTKIGFGEKGQLFDVVNALNVLRFNTGLVHEIAVVFHVFIDMLYLLDDFFVLDFAERVESGGLDLRLIIMSHWLSSYS